MLGVLGTVCESFGLSLVVLEQSLAVQGLIEECFFDRFLRVFADSGGIFSSCVF